MLEPRAIKMMESRMRDLPQAIYESEIKMIEEKAEVERNKYNLEAEQSVIISVSERNNATEKRAEAIKGTEKSKHILIDTILKMEKAKAQLTKLNNEFTALRKISSIECEIMRNDN